MKNSDYWRGRFSLLERSTYRIAQAAMKELEVIYRQALYKTRKELESWCARFADDNGVSLTETRRLLNTRELEEFRWDVEQYIETAQKSGLDESYQRQLRNASARVHISRLEAIETQIRQQIETLYSGQEAQLSAAVRRAADEAYTGTVRELAKGLDTRFQTVSLDKAQLDALTAKAWTTDDRTFRDRCWTNKQALVQAVHKGLTQSLLRGDSPAKLTDAITKQFNVDRYKAGRLVYTETAYYSALAEKQGFKDMGVEKVEIIGTLDGDTCDVCGALDGKHIPLAQYEPGVTVPPFHPRCRCTTAPVVPEAFAEGVRIARDETGQQYTVPAGMTWQEWKKRETAFPNAESSYSAGVGSSKTDFDYINSDRYRAKFNSISDDPALNQSIYKYCKAAVTHQSGDYYEDLTILRKDGSLVGQTSGKVRNETQYNRALSNAVKSAEPYSLISIHNHGTNVPPSGADFGSAGEKKYAFGIVACHDGTIYKYSTKHARPFAVSVIDKKVDIYLKPPYNMGVIEAFQRTLRDIQESYGIEWSEIK